MAVADMGFVEVAANSTFEWFIHGWNAKEAVTYSIVVFPGDGPGVPFPVGRATLTQGEYFQHVDGTFAQKIHIRNNAPFNSAHVRVLGQFESV